MTKKLSEADSFRINLIRRFLLFLCVCYEFLLASLHDEPGFVTLCSGVWGFDWLVHLGSAFLSTSVISLRKMYATLLTCIYCISCFKSILLTFGAISSSDVMLNCLTIFCR